MSAILARLGGLSLSGNGLRVELLACLRLSFFVIDFFVPFFAFAYLIWMVLT